MKYIDKNLIIERYVNGAMTPEEIQGFNALLETDSELRSMFQAENIIKSTIAKERYALEAVNHSNSYAFFLKGLANSIPQTAAATSAAGAGKAASWLSGISTSVKIAVSAAVVTGSAVVGTLVMQPTAPQENTLPQHNVQKPSVEYAPMQEEKGSAQEVQLPTVEGKQDNPQSISVEAPSTPTVNRQSTPTSTRSQQENTIAAPRKQRDEGIPSFHENNVNISVQSDSAKK